MDIKYFSASVIFSFLAVFLDINFGFHYILVITFLSVISYYFLKHYSECLSNRHIITDLHEQARSQFFEKNEEVASAYQQLIEKERAIENVSEMVSSKMANSISIADSYLMLMKEEELSDDEKNIFVEKISEEVGRLSETIEILVDNITGREKELYLEEVNLFSLMNEIYSETSTTVTGTVEKKLTIPCNRNELKLSLVDLFTNVPEIKSVEATLKKTPKSFISSENIKISFTLSEDLSLNERDKERIFAHKIPSNTKKAIKSLHDMRKTIDKHKGSFWISEKTIHFTIPVKFEKQY